MKNQLKEFRKSRHITQQEIADICGVAQNTISNWESGRQDISLDNVNKIANYYKIEPQQIAHYNPIENTLGIMKDMNDLGLFGMNYTQEQIDEELEDIGKNPEKQELLERYMQRQEEIIPIIGPLLLFDDEPYNNIQEIIKKLSYQDKDTIKKIKDIINILVKK